MLNIVIILIVLLILKAVFSAADVSFTYINKKFLNFYIAILLYK